jgi:hypothetical protein
VPSNIAPLLFPVPTSPSSVSGKNLAAITCILIRQSKESSHSTIPKRVHTPRYRREFTLHDTEESSHSTIPRREFTLHDPEESSHSTIPRREFTLHDAPKRVHTPRCLEESSHSTIPKRVHTPRCPEAPKRVHTPRCPEESSHSTIPRREFTLHDAPKPRREFTLHETLPQQTRLHHPQQLSLPNQLDLIPKACLPVPSVYIPLLNLSAGLCCTTWTSSSVVSVTIKKATSGRTAD